jgi:lipoprotein-releasing system permease protein
MNLPFFIAKRYLVSKKKRNIINIISGVAITGVTIGTIALVVVLSVYNGFNSLIHSMFSSFDPDLKITAVEGKSFDGSDLDLRALENTQGVALVAEVLQESAILEYGSSRGVVTIKGVSENYSRVTGLDSLIYDGRLMFEEKGIPYAIIGLGVAINLGIRLNLTDPMHIYAAKKGEQIAMNLARSLNHEYIYPSAIFSVQETYDSEYVFVPLDFARTLFGVPEKISALEIKLTPESNLREVQKQIQDQVGPLFHVKNKYQQQELIYKVMNSEKWAIYFILVFILAIASFNIIGSLSMLIIDKKDDIAILRSMGADSSDIRKAFLYEGWLITLTGAITGLLAGVLICLAQIHFALLKLPGDGSFAVSAYPVELNITHLFLSLGTVLAIGFITSWIPIRYFSRKYMDTVHIG